METSPRSDSIWFVLAVLAAALGGIAAIAAIAAPVDAEPTLRLLPSLSASTDAATPLPAPQPLAVPVR